MSEEGLRRKDERPPEDHWAVRNEEMEQKLLDDYYEFKGWNKEGIPTKETLDKLGLGYVSEDFMKRGILTENENCPQGDFGAKREEIKRRGDNREGWVKKENCQRDKSRCR